MVCEKRSLPADKACGEGIMPEGVEALGALGVDLSATGSARLQGIRFVDAECEVCASFAQGTGLAMRRTALHATPRSATSMHGGRTSKPARRQS